MPINQSSTLHSRELPLVGQGLLTGLTATVLCTVANSLFLTAYGPGHLPMVYLGLALFVPIVSLIYTTARARLSRVAVAYGFSTTMFTVCLAGWGYHHEHDAPWIGYVLLMAWNAYVLVGMLLQGDQIQRLFDVREIKRANPIILTGNIVGAVAGGLLVGPLIAYLGTTTDLLLFCCVLIPLNLALEHSTIARFPALRTPATKRSSAGMSSALSLRQALNNRYIVLVLVFGVFYVLMFRMLTYLFMSSAHRLTTSADDLAHLIGICMAVGKAGSFLFVLFGSTRVMHRLGLGASLAASPALIGPLILGAVAATLVQGEEHQVVLWIIVGAYLLGHSLDSGTTVTALRASLQALPLSHRTAADTVASGLGKAVADALAGSLILLIDALHESADLAIMILILIVAMAWVLTSRFISRGYATLLLQSLKKRSLRTATVEVRDPQTLSILQECLKGPDSEHRSFALDLLRDSHHPSYVAQVLECARSEEESLATMAIARIESERIHEGSAFIEQQMHLELPPNRKAVVIGAHAALLEAEAIPHVVPWLDSPSVEVRKSAYTALLRHCGIGGAIEVGRRLTSHYSDADPGMRAFAADVMGLVGDAGLYEYLRPLLSDVNRAVQVRALHAAFRVRHARLVPVLESHLSDPELRPLAIRALSEAGDCLLPHLAALLEDPRSPALNVVWLLRASQVKGDDGLLRLLKKHLRHPVEEVRQQVLKTIVKLGHTAEGEEVEETRDAIRHEVHIGLRLLETESSLGQGPEFAPLRRALGHEGFLRRERVSLLLTFLVDPSLILRATDALLHGVAAERAIALETLELHLPGELRYWVLPFLNVAEPAKSRAAQLASHFPTPPGDRHGATLAEIISNDDGQWTHTWTRIWAIHSRAWPVARQLFASDQAHWDYTWARVWTSASARSPTGTQTGNAQYDWSREAAAIRKCLEDPDPTLQAVAEWSLSIHDACVRAPGGPPGPRTILLEGQLPMMITLEKLNILHQVDLFKETPDHALLSVAEIAEEMEVPAGETFMRRGTPGDFIFVVVTGQVRVHFDSATIEVLGPFTCIGLASIIESAPRTASATATEDAVVLRISKRAFDEVLAEQPEVAKATMKQLSRQVLLAAQKAASPLPHGK